MAANKISAKVIEQIFTKKNPSEKTHVYKNRVETAKRILQDASLADVKTAHKVYISKHPDGVEYKELARVRRQMKNRLSAKVYVSKKISKTARVSADLKELREACRVTECFLRHQNAVCHFESLVKKQDPMDSLLDSVEIIKLRNYYL